MINFAIIYSKKDQAGCNIAECLKQFFLPHIPIIETNKETIYLEGIDEKQEFKEKLKKVDFIIFATKHQAKEQRNTLSLHAPGNFRNADFGGKPGKICKTSSLALKFLFEKMSENKEKAGLDYELTMECTHHGPLIEKPCCFIEIGTSENQWNDKKAGQIIAKTIVDFQDFENWKNQKENKNIKTAIGIGGPHYCPNFNKIQLSKTAKIAVGHIIPGYQLPLSESIIYETINKIKEQTDIILVDWKGCGNSEERQKVLEVIEKTRIPYERTENIEK